jgi:hypothetical protein
VDDHALNHRKAAYKSVMEKSLSEMAFHGHLYNLSFFLLNMPYVRTPAFITQNHGIASELQDAQLPELTASSPRIPINTASDLSGIRPFGETHSFLGSIKIQRQKRYAELRERLFSRNLPDFDPLLDSKKIFGELSDSDVDKVHVRFICGNGNVSRDAADLFNLKLVSLGLDDYIFAQGGGTFQLARKENSAQLLLTEAAVPLFPNLDRLIHVNLDWIAAARKHYGLSTIIGENPYIDPVLGMDDYIRISLVNAKKSSNNDVNLLWQPLLDRIVDSVKKRDEEMKKV